MAVVIVMMVLVLALSGGGLAKKKATREDDFHLVKREVDNQYLSNKLEEWLDDGSYDKSCIEEFNAKETCPINKADCVSKCQTNNAKMVNLMKEINPCLSKRFCQIDLEDIILSEVQEKINVSNYNGWCNFRGSKPTVTNANKPTLGNATSHLGIPYYLIKVFLDLFYSNVYVDCEPYEITQNGSNTDAFSGPVFISQNIVFDIIVKNNKDKADFDYGNEQEITPNVTFSDPKHPSKSTIPQIYQDQVRTEVIKLFNYFVMSFWVQLIGEMYENMYVYYVYPSCPKCK